MEPLKARMEPSNKLELLLLELQSWVPHPHDHPPISMGENPTYHGCWSPLRTWARARRLDTPRNGRLQRLGVAGPSYSVPGATAWQGVMGLWINGLVLLGKSTGNIRFLPSSLGLSMGFRLKFSHHPTLCGCSSQKMALISYPMVNKHRPWKSHCFNGN